MAVHYGTVIIPARVRKPRDKAKVEVGVQVVERWILAALRNRTFFHVSELNEAIGELVATLNQRPFKKLPGSRYSWFKRLEQEALLPLPQCRYVFAEWKKARVNIDYHVELHRHYYSVPYSLVQEVVDIRSTATVVEMFFRGKRVASHRRNDQPGQHTTHKEHMPKHHQQYVEWSPSRIIRWASTVGEATAQVIETILNSRKYPEQGYRSCLGILRLGKHYSNDRLEAACRRAIAIGSCRYKSIRSILENGLDRVPLTTRPVEPPIKHHNIRGGGYYH
jgi:transposase